METPKGGLGQELPVSTPGGGGITLARWIGDMTTGPLLVALAGGNGAVNPPIDAEEQVDNLAVVTLKGDTTPGLPAIYYQLPAAGLYNFHVHATVDASAGGECAGYMDVALGFPIDWGAGFAQIEQTFPFHINDPVVGQLSPFNFEMDSGPVWCQAAGAFPVGVGTFGVVNAIVAAGGNDLNLTVWRVEIERLA